MLSRLSTILIAASVIFNTGCRNKKAIARERAEELDTVFITASRHGTRPVYRETNPQVNDLLHTSLAVSFDWQDSRLAGTATLHVKPYFYPVNTLALNAKGMEIKKVEVYEIPVTDEADGTVPAGAAPHKMTGTTYTYDQDSIHVFLGRLFDRSETYTVVIDYVARPNELSAPGGSQAITEDKGLYFVNPLGENPFRMPQIWTQGETQSSSVWFPTIDSPNEKMTQEIFMTVDDRYATLSNGRLISSEKQPGGKRTDHWKQALPHAPYLAMMAVGEFLKVVDEPWNGKEISYYVEKEYAPYVKAIFGETKQMIDFYSKAFGYPFPWDKYAQIAVREYVSGAMENTSATLHGDFMVYQTDREIEDVPKATAVIAHELVHQWFGDVVTCESWSNLPLNESFATYGEYIWFEHRYGREAADEHLWHSRQAYMRSRQEANLIRFNYRDREDMFDNISYSKGAQVMHMLRRTVGTEAFFAGLSRYLHNNEYRPVEIHHLRLAMEEVTGRDLNWFFNQWFLASGRPILKVEKHFDAASKKLRLIVEQLQDLSRVPLYRLPLYVDIYVGDSVARHPVIINNVRDTFYLPVKVQPEFVNFDSDRSILAEVNYQRTAEELIRQYSRAPLFLDRMEALNLLEPTLNDSAVFVLFRDAALEDGNATIRKHAISRLEKCSPEHAFELKQILMRSLRRDTSGSVRAVALATLNRRFLNDPEVVSLNEGSFRDTSYAVIAEALTSLARRDPGRAVRRAMSLEKEKGRDVIMSAAGVFAAHGDDGHIGFFRSSIPYLGGTDLVTFCVYYARLGTRCNIPGSVLTIATDLEMMSKGASRYTRYGVDRGLKELLTAFDQKEAALKHKAGGARGETADEINRQLSGVSDMLVKLRAIYERAKL